MYSSTSVLRGIACAALILAWCPSTRLFAAPGSSAAKDAAAEAPSRYGDVLYHTPPGWVEKEDERGVTITPPAPGASLFIMPVREFPDWRQFFDAVQKPSAGEQLVGRVPLTVKHDANGFDELYAGQVLKNSKGEQVFEWYGAAHKGQFIQVLYFRAQGLDHYRALHPALARFIQTLQFETSPADVGERVSG
ncbi:MAG TPA: hypothetical protein VFJ58_19335 [Armatimonadota bacterium]|nr:hypothetical protein [Armatimonadota bacterium]